MHPSISIITPSFNQGRYLEENILSVQKQEYPALQHILIDGGSTDSTPEIIKKYSGHFSYAISERDKGQSHALNKGFAQANGEIIGWLNSDDYYAPGALIAIAKAFSESNVEVVTGCSYLLQEGKDSVLNKQSYLGKFSFEDYFRYPDINQPATFFRREILASLVPFNEKLHYVMDRELWIKYLLKYDVTHIKAIEDVIAFFRYHPESKSGTKEMEFENEYAAILHFFAVKNNLNEVAEALSSFYPLIAGYSFDFDKLPDTETTLNMIRYLFLKRRVNVYNREEFDFARRMFPLLKLNKYRLLPEEEGRMERMTSLQKYLNWNHFRLSRKLDSLTNPKDR